jgi:hypothetical protein
LSREDRQRSIARTPVARNTLTGALRVLLFESYQRLLAAGPGKVVKGCGCQMIENSRLDKLFMLYLRLLHAFFAQPETDTRMHAGPNPGHGVINELCAFDGNHIAVRF